MTRKRCLMFTAAIAIAAALSGCSTSGSEGPPQAAVATYPLTLEARELDQIVALRDVAVEIQTEQCMIDLGFPRVDRVSFAQNRQRPTAEPLQEWTNVRPNSATATELGFDSLPVATLIDTSDETPSYPELDAMTEAEQQNWHRALLGTDEQSATYSGPGGISGGFSTGGCYGTARLELFEVADGGFGSFLVQRSMLDNLRNDAYSRVRSSKAIAEALQSWQRCMSEAGFGEYEDPNEVIPTLVRLHTAGDNTAEVALTVADANCFDHSQLIETWDNTMATAETELSQTNEFVTVRNWGEDNYPSLVETFTPIIEQRATGAS